MTDGHKISHDSDEVVREIGRDIKVEKVSDMKEIMKYPVLMIPGLVINEKLVVSGKVPSKAEVTKYVTSALAEQ